MCYNQNEKKLKFYVEITFISRAIPISAKGSANYESPCSTGRSKMFQYIDTRVIFLQSETM